MNGVPKNAGTHNAWIGAAAAGGYDLRSESYQAIYLARLSSCAHAF